MLDNNFTERITLTSLLIPNDELNIPGIIKMTIQNIEDYVYQNPGIYNFSINKGNTLDLTFIYKNDQLEPIDLTGYTISSTAININNTSITFNLNPVITSPLDGKIEIHMSANETSLIPSLYFNDQYKYDIDIINNNISLNIMTGIINVCQ